MNQKAYALGLYDGRNGFTRGHSYDPEEPGYDKGYDKGDRKRKTMNFGEMLDQELYDAEAEKNAAWCDRCMAYHGGDCEEFR